MYISEAHACSLHRGQKGHQIPTTTVTGVGAAVWDLGTHPWSSGRVAAAEPPLQPLSSSSLRIHEEIHPCSKELAMQSEHVCGPCSMRW